MLLLLVSNSPIYFQDVIKKKVADFQKTEREIQEKLDEAERRKGGSVSRSTTPDSNDNDSQVDARRQGQCFFYIQNSSLGR